MDNILKRFCVKHNIVLRKGENMHIVYTLLWNYVLLLKLRIYKWIHGIHHPIIHYYAVCWNEEKMLPFMFDYYEQFVDHFTIYDNYSDDNSEEIIRSRKNTEIIRFKSDGFNDTIHQDIKNNCWKKSRGKADYVIVCDMDEFIYHPQMTLCLGQMQQHGLSLSRPRGFDMYNEIFPQHDNVHQLTVIVRTGIASKKYSKSILFDPHRIVEINYEPGCHFCHPVGCVRSSDDEELKLLHYKNIGIDAMIKRNREYARRLSKSNIENEFGIEYLRKEEIIKNEFYNNLKNSCQVI